MRPNDATKYPSVPWTTPELELGTGLHLSGSIPGGFIDHPVPASGRRPGRPALVDRYLEVAVDRARARGMSPRLLDSCRLAPDSSRFPRGHDRCSRFLLARELCSLALTRSYVQSAQLPCALVEVAP